MLIKKCYQSRLSGDQLLSENTFDYAKDSVNLGRPAGATYKHYPNDGSGQSYATTWTFVCDNDPALAGALRYTTTVSTHDGLTVSRSRSWSAFTGRILRSTNAQGVTSAFAYNAAGQLSARTLAVGTDYENTMTFGLVVTAGDDDAFQTIATDSNTNQVCQGLDGMGRRVYMAINSVDDSVSDTKYKLTTQTFDQFGRLATSTRTDYLLDPEESYSVTGTPDYDEWGRPSRMNYNNGSWRSSSIDPIARTATTVAGGEVDQVSVTTGQIVVSYDIGGKPVKVAHYAANVDAATATPYSVRQMFYDGLKRLTTDIDPLGNTTTYKYDAWSRVIETTLPEGTVVKRRYRADSPARQAVEITLANAAQQVAETSMGKRAFDGLGRIVSANIGQWPWQYQYEAPNANSQLMDRRATTVIASDGIMRQYTYIPELGGALETVKTSLPGSGDDGAITQSYVYDHTTGALTSAGETAVPIESTSTIQYTTHPSGRPKSQIAALDDTTGTMTQDRYTVGGRRYQYTHVDGAVRITKRDPFGRIIEVSDAQMKVTLNYDPASRLTDWLAYDLTSERKLHTTLTLDDYGREVGRTIWQDDDPPANPTWSITQTWNQANLLTSRTIAHTGSAYRKETYRYDQRNRLTNWTSSGTSPTDRYGNILLAQDFTLDPFSNITQVVSTFPNDQSNTACFWYDGDPTVPYVLSSYSNTHASYPAHDGKQAKVYCDQANRIQDDGMGNTFDWYDQLGRLKEVTTASGSTYYGYDAHNRKYSQVTSNPTTYFYYDAGALVNRVRGTDATRLMHSPVGSPLQYIDQADGGNVWLAMADGQGSVLAARDGTNSEEYAYSPYGEDQFKARATQQGYTGQYRDPILPGYMLGNGYRAYLPALMRFGQPDSPAYSPFGKGGVNPYIYCGSDPVNRSDPSGHFFLFNWIHKIDHGIGNFFSKNMPWFSHWFNSLGDLLYNYTTKGGILSFLPDQYNPVAQLERLAGPVIQSPLFGATPFGAAIQGLGWVTNSAAGFIHNTTGLSNSWSMLGVMGAESIAGAGVGGFLSGATGFETSLTAGSELGDIPDIGTAGSDGEIVETSGRVEGGPEGLPNEGGGDSRPRAQESEMEEKRTPPPSYSGTQPWFEWFSRDETGHVMYPSNYPNAPIAPPFRYWNPRDLPSYWDATMELTAPPSYVGDALFQFLESPDT